MWVVEPLCLGTFHLAQEHHRCAPVLQLGEDRLCLSDVANAVECPEDGHARLASMPSLERHLPLQGLGGCTVEDEHRRGHRLTLEPCWHAFGLHH